MNAEMGSRKQSPHAMAGRLIMIAVPIRFIPFGMPARIGRLIGCLLSRALRLRLPCRGIARQALID
jgi:hypothetical protein